MNPTDKPPFETLPLGEVVTDRLGKSYRVGGYEGDMIHVFEEGSSDFLGYATVKVDLTARLTRDTYGPASPWSALRETARQLAALLGIPVEEIDLESLPNKVQDLGRRLTEQVTHRHALEARLQKASTAAEPSRATEGDLFVPAPGTPEALVLELEQEIASWNDDPESALPNWRLLGDRRSERTHVVRSASSVFGYGVALRVDGVNWHLVAEAAEDIGLSEDRVFATDGSDGARSPRAAMRDAEEAWRERYAVLRDRDREIAVFGQLLPLPRSRVTTVLGTLEGTPVPISPGWQAFLAGQAAVRAGQRESVPPQASAPRGLEPIDLLLVPADNVAGFPSFTVNHSGGGGSGGPWQMRVGRVTKMRTCLPHDHDGATVAWKFTPGQGNDLADYHHQPSDTIYATAEDAATALYVWISDPSVLDRVRVMQAPVRRTRPPDTTLPAVPAPPTPAKQREHDDDAAGVCPRCFCSHDSHSSNPQGCPR